MFRIPTPVLAVVLGCVAALDALVVMPTAFAVDDAVAEAAPEAVPLEAFVTGPVIRDVDLDGVIARGIRDGEHGVAVLFTNPGEVEREVAVNVEVWQTTGSAMSRMGPMSHKLEQTELTAIVPAGGQVTVPLETIVKVSEAPETVVVEEELNFMMSFSTIEFMFATEGQPRDWHGRPTSVLPLQVVALANVNDDASLAQLP